MKLIFQKNNIFMTFAKCTWLGAKLTHTFYSFFIYPFIGTVWSIALSRSAHCSVLMKNNITESKSRKTEIYFHGSNKFLDFVQKLYVLIYDSEEFTIGIFFWRTVPFCWWQLKLFEGNFQCSVCLQGCWRMFCNFQNIRKTVKTNFWQTIKKCFSKKFTAIFTKMKIFN